MNTTEPVPLEVGQVRRDIGGSRYTVADTAIDVEGRVSIKIAAGTSWAWSYYPAKTLLTLPVVEPIPESKDAWAVIWPGGERFVCSDRASAVAVLADTDAAVGIARMMFDVDSFVGRSELEAEGVAS